MNKYNTHLKQKGFTFIELMVVLAVLGLLWVISFPKGEQVTGFGDEVAFRTQAEQLNIAAASYKGMHTVFTGVSMSLLISEGHLKEALIHPWGGAFQINVDSSDPTRYVLTATGITNSAIGNKMANYFSKIAPSSVFNGTTLTTTYQG